MQIHNRHESCCKNYNIESRVDVLDSAGNVVKSVVLTRQDLVHNLWFGGIEGKVIKMTKLKPGALIISEKHADTFISLASILTHIFLQASLLFGKCRPKPSPAI